MHMRSALLLLLAAPPSLLLACADEPEVIDCASAGKCTIQIASGDMQTAEVGALLPEPFVVQVLHGASGTVPPPVDLEWTVVEGDGSVTPATTTIDANGAASTSARIGTMAGPTANRFAVQIAGQPGSAVEFVAAGTAGAARSLEAVSGGGQEAIAGSELPEKFVVRVVDAHGNPVAERRVRWDVTAGGGEVRADESATDENGEVTASATLGPIAGDENNLFTATSPQLSGSARFLATALAGPAAVLEKVSGDRQGGTRQQVLSEPIVVRVTDMLGNAVVGVTVEFEATDGAGTVEPATVVTDDEGAAAATTTLGAEAGEHRFTASVNGLTGSPATFTQIAFPPICSANDWCWYSPVPQGNSMNGAHAITPEDVWVVGDNGTALRWLVAAWRGYVTPTDRDLNAVWGADDDDAWAVGEGGTLLHFNGFTWMSVQSGTVENLNAIFGVAADDIWAVGDAGTLLHYDGLSWSLAQSPTTEPLRGVTAAGPNDFWAVGDRGTALTLSGSTWERVDVTVTSEDLHAVHALAPDNVWAVGDGDTYLRWNGAAWLAFPSSSQAALRGVYGVSANEVWAVGERGRIRRFDGANWNSVISRTASAIHAVVPTSRGLIAVGAGGLLLRRVGSDWQLEANRRLHTLQGIWGTATDDLWAVGNNGTILRWEGATWSEIPEIPNAQFVAVQGSGPSDVWAVGELGFAMRYDGTSWRTVATRTNESLNALHVFSSTLAYAVGVGGTVIEWDGADWSEVPVPTTNTLYGVWGASPNDIWVFGEFGAVLHYDGVAWTSRADVTTESILGVRGTAANDIWAFGAAGALLYYNGTTWMPAVSGTTESLFSMAVSGTERWICGGSGTVLRFDGNNWRREDSGTDNVLFGIFSPEPGDLWTVGESSTILRQNP